jgi:leucyl aminopeptidase
MTAPRPSFVETDLETIALAPGGLAVLVSEDGKLDPAGRRVNRLTKGALQRAVESDAFEALSEGKLMRLGFPAGMQAEAIYALKLSKKASLATARKAGAELAKAAAKKPISLMVGSFSRAADIVFGLVTRSYTFETHKTTEPSKALSLTVSCSKPTQIQDAYRDLHALACGMFLTRDLVNEPANVLTTTEFANRLARMSDLGLSVKVLDEDELAELGMRTLLSVGQGSDSPSKVVVMEWNGGAPDDAPLALVGKGVVFDTGGISLKPAAGMEDMTMDMGGAGTVAGAMCTIAMRKAKANVVGLVGLVENMPSGNATRPGDVVRSMKGDTVEIINTDAEGRLVLCDVMWYAQEAYKPAAMIDLATLTGAVIIGLGHENAGVFSNDDGFCQSFLDAAGAENEGAWRMPLGKAYDDQLKSRIADMKNVGGRPAGSITAAQFLQRFVQKGTPWIHLDIAGVASVKSETALAPKGATGWGVLALNRLVADKYES